MNNFYIKIRNNLLPHQFIYSILFILFQMAEFRFSFWGKAMDITGKPGNQLPFSF